MCEIMSRREFKILDEKTEYKSQWLSVSELLTETDGVKRGTYSVVNKKDCVIMVIENTKKELLLVRSFRYPTGKYAWEFPAGGIENDEVNDSAAMRETFEEVGIRIKLWEIGAFHPLPGLTSQMAFVYYGKVNEKEKHVVEEYKESVDEIIDRQFFSLDKIKEMILGGSITDGLTISALIFWKIGHKE